MRLNRLTDLCLVHVLAAAEERPAVTAVPYPARKQLRHEGLIRYRVECPGGRSVSDRTKGLPELIGLSQGLKLLSALRTNRHAISFFYFI